jgi:hypothetical protein
MILERQREMIPVAPAAFTRAQATAQELQSYQGALVISRGGRVVPVERVETRGFWGSSFFQRMTSALSGTREIRVQFGPPKSMTLDEFKRLVITYLDYDRERGDPYLPQADPAAVVSERVMSASTFEQVFEAIRVPELEHCLDVL